MSLPVNIGDFIVICQLAYTVYSRCKSSVTEFRELSREVESLQIVLDEIRSFWQERKRRGDDLPHDKALSLARITADCGDVLKSLQDLLHDHRRLGTGQSLRQRLRWAPRDIGPIRNRLLLQTMYLSILNSQLTAMSAVTTREKQHAQLLVAINTINKEYNDGDRRKPALSQATSEKLVQDDGQLWDDIASEMERENVDRSVTYANRAFVKNWIGRVMLQDVGESDEYDQNDEPVKSINNAHQVPVADIQKPYTESDRTVSWVKSHSFNSHSLPELVFDYSESDSQSREIPFRPNKSPSCSSHRSKESNWRPINGPNPEYVKGLLEKLLRLDCTSRRNEESLDLLTKRIFHQLDFTDEGHLYYHTIDQHFWSPTQLSEPRFERKEFAKLIRDADTSNDNKIDFLEFSTFVDSLVTTIGAFREADFKRQIDTDSSRGILLMEKYLVANTDSSIRWNWKLINGEWQFKNNDRVLFRSPNVPRTASDTFSNMELVANGLCINVLQSRFEKWYKKLSKLPVATFEEYKGPIQTVLNIAAKFSLFRKDDIKGLDKYDDILGFVLHTYQDKDLDHHPVGALRYWKDESFKLLQLVLGFVVIVDQDLSSQLHDDPPPLDQWRQLQMRKRAEYIKKTASVLSESQSRIDEVWNWVQERSGLAKDALNAIESAVDIREQQAAVKSQRTNRETPVLINVTGLSIFPKRLIVGNIQFSASLCKISPNGFGILRPVSSGQNSNSSLLNDDFKCNVSASDMFQINVECLSDTPGVPLGVTMPILQSQFCVRDIGDLRLERPCQKTLSLTGLGPLSRSSIVVTITPTQDTRVQAPSNYQYFSSYQELMSAILNKPLPSPWQVKKTCDGRTYLESSYVPQVPEQKVNRFILRRNTSGSQGANSPPSTPGGTIKKTAACYVP